MPNILRKHLGAPVGSHLALPLALLLFCAACASREKVSPFGARDEIGNFYRTYAVAQDKEFQKRLNKSPLYLFRGSLEAFYRSVSQRARHSGLLQSFAPTLVHGDFHPGQVVFREGVPMLDDFDTTDWGPWWIDVLRAETGALLVAREQGLRLYRAGACVDAYRTALDTRRASGELPAKARQVEPAVLFPEQKFWQRTTPVDAATAKKFLDQLATLEGHPFPAETPVRKSGSGVGSWVMEKYLVMVSDKRLVEFKAQNANPLAGLDESPASGKHSACERFTAGAQLFQPQKKWRCVVVDGTSFGVIESALSYREVESEDFTNEKELEADLAWSCSRLALAHAQNWAPAQLRVVQTSLSHAPQLRARILDWAALEAERVQTAHRMALAKSP